LASHSIFIDAKRSVYQAPTLFQ